MTVQRTPGPAIDFTHAVATNYREQTGESATTGPDNESFGGNNA
jgi:hypothetical protein